MRASLALGKRLTDCIVYTEIYIKFSIINAGMRHNETVEFRLWLDSEVALS